jgi:hypothetical protein
MPRPYMPGVDACRHRFDAFPITRKAQPHQVRAQGFLAILVAEYPNQPVQVLLEASLGTADALHHAPIVSYTTTSTGPLLTQ